VKWLLINCKMVLLSMSTSITISITQSCTCYECYLGFFSTSSVDHYKKVTFYFVKKRCEGNKRNKSIITPCTLRYSLCLQIHQFLAMVYRWSGKKNQITLVTLKSIFYSCKFSYLELEPDETGGIFKFIKS
jgi:hypothetical protein